MTSPLRTRTSLGARAPYTLLLGLLCACGGDARPDGDASAGLDDSSTGDGGSASDSGLGVGDAAITTDAGPPGPAVTVDPSASIILQTRELREVCLLNAQGAVACRGPSTELRVVRKGPFVSFVSHQEGVACGLTSAGTLDCWTSKLGEDALCRAGDPGCLHGGLPPAGVTWKDVAVSEQHGCGVASDGTLQCWGESSEQTNVPAGTNFVRLAIGAPSIREGSCALTSAGTLKCWSDSSSFFQDFLDTPNTLSLAMHGAGVCVVRSDGTIACDNWAISPPHAPAGKKFAQVTMHEDGMCSLTTDGQARCIGGAAITRVTPPVGPFQQIASTPSYACGLRGDGQLQCWGDQWGNGAGVESCALFEAKLDVSGQARNFKVDSTAWQFADLTLGTGWRLGTHLEPQQYLHLLGEGTLKGADVYANLPARIFPANTALNLRASYWLLDATDSGIGAITCSGAGSAHLNGDELLVDLQKVATLACPGRAVEGSISFCAGQRCTRGSGTGSVHGVPWTEVGRGAPGPLYDQTPLEGGSLLVARRVESSPNLRWALLFTGADGPFQGEVLCVGAGQYIGSDLPNSFQLSNLSVLDTCPASATGTLTGCLR